MSQSGNKGQYQPIVILVLLLAVSLSFIHFYLRPNQEMETQKQNYRAFYTRRIFHTVMKKKVEYKGKNHTLIQLAGEAVCPRDGSQCNGEYYPNFIKKANSTLNKTLKEKYRYYMAGNSDTNCNFEFPEIDKTYLERATIVQYEGLGYNGCSYTLKFAVWVD